MRVRPSRVRRLRVRKAIGNVALAAAVLSVVGAFLAIQKTVTLVVDGRPDTVRTMSASVGELLDAEGIELSPLDLVVPSRTTPLLDGMTVLVELRYQGEFTAVPAPTDVGVWVMEGVPASSAMLAVRRTEDWFSAGRRPGQRAVVAARVVVMGKDYDVLTNATTVRKLLSAMGIEPDRNDRVLPSLSAPLKQDVKVRFDSIEYRTRELEVPIPFTTFTGYTDDLDPGEEQWVRQGVDGLMLERYRVRVVNGKVATRTLLDRQVLREAIAAKRLVGRNPATGGTQVGEASWYSFAPGDGLTAAHPWLPFGTVVTVTNLDNGTSVRVVINDRGTGRSGGRRSGTSPSGTASGPPRRSGSTSSRTRTSRAPSSPTPASDRAIASSRWAPGWARSRSRSRRPAATSWRWSSTAGSRRRCARSSGASETSGWSRSTRCARTGMPCWATAAGRWSRTSRSTSRSRWSSTSSSASPRSAGTW
jgi:uncharacterized protein YabE (DUF348 family)